MLKRKITNPIKRVIRSKELNKSKEGQADELCKPTERIRRLEKQLSDALRYLSRE